MTLKKKNNKTKKRKTLTVILKRHVMDLFILL